MKKTILFLSFIITMTTYSQGIIGVYAGLNTLSINSNTKYYELENLGVGFELGASYKYYFTDNFNALIEVGYANAKLNFKYNLFDIDMYDIDEITTQKGYTQTLNYLKYTMLGNYNFNENFGIIAGPNLEAYMNNEGYQPEMEIGMAVGLIGNYENFSLDLRYNLGLTNVLGEDDYSTSDLSVKHNGINLRFTYYFYEF